MSRYKHLLPGIILLITLVAPLTAADTDSQFSEFVTALINNQYLLENIRLIKLAEESYAASKYDDAIQYAQESIKYALLSDEYVSLQKKIKEANDAITAAQTRLDWAKKIGAPKRYAEIYGKAENVFTDALDARSREDWNAALESALQVITILAEIPDTPVFAAQYKVKNWIPMKDCLWNIAGKPEIYGDPFKWRVIYNANKSKLSKPDNPDLLLPGIILDIPSIKGEVRFGITESME